MVKKRWSNPLPHCGTPPKRRSKLEVEMELLLRAEPDLAGWCAEYWFALPEREWRFDFAWEAEKVALEVEGVHWHKKDRHTTPVGYIGDVEKYNEGVLRGWLLIRVTAKHIRNGQAVEWARRALEQRRTGKG